MSVRGSVPAGWYADPCHRYAHRYWTGEAWGAHVSSTTGEQLEDPLTSEMVSDPGWRTALISMIPWWGLVVMRRNQANPFTRLRFLFLTFYTSLALIGFVAVEIAPTPRSTKGPSIAVCLAILAVFGAIALAGVMALRRRRLTGTSTLELAKQYRSAFFAKIACAESVALIGFVLAIITHRPWLYFVGGAITAIEWALATPSHHDIYRHEAPLAPAFLAPPKPDQGAAA